jgi:hypothetical protein
MTHPLLQAYAKSHQDLVEYFEVDDTTILFEDYTDYTWCYSTYKDVVHFYRDGSDFEVYVTSVTRKDDLALFVDDGNTPFGMVFSVENEIAYPDLPSEYQSAWRYNRTPLDGYAWSYDQDNKFLHVENNSTVIDVETHDGPYLDDGSVVFLVRNELLYLSPALERDTSH